MIKLRTYQDKGVNQIREALRAGHKSVLYVAPCGAGKTVLFTYVAANAAARRTRTVICVHRRELLLQASRALTEQGVPHGIIAPGQPSTPHVIQVASVQTLVRRKGLKFDFLVFDEAHHCTANTYKTICAAHPNARILGVTATPCRMTGAGLGTVFDHMIMGPHYSELIDHGHLVSAVVYAPALMPNLDGVRSRAGDYVRERLAAVMDTRQITGNAVEHYRRLCNGLPAIVFCVSVEHANHVAEDFAAQGFRSAVVDGKTQQDIRDDRIASLEDGRLNVLASCDLISEGVDIPVVSVAILLRPTKSTGLYMQQAGRVLRPSQGKDKAIILDHVGNSLKHGLPDQDRDWTLEDGYVPHKREADEDGPDVRACEQCYAVHEWAKECPYCGYVYPVKVVAPPEEVEGNLEPITQEEREEMLKQARTASLSDLHKIGKRLGYKKGWAWVQIMGRRRASGKLARAKVGGIR